MDDRDIKTGLPFDSGVDTAVERWFREHFHAATALGFPMAGYVAGQDTQRRLRDRIAELLAEVQRLTVQAARFDAEWSAGHPYKDGRPGLCVHGNQGERNARQMGAYDGWTVLRRLVGPWCEVAAVPKPAHGPTPNGILCTCGEPFGHDEPIGEIDV